METATLASIEAFHLGDGRRKRETRLETLGYIWGWSRREGNRSTFYLDRLHLSLSSVRTNSSVTPDPEAARLQNAVIERWAPEVRLLGDFHSHPYETRKDVAAIKGYGFSDEDFKSFLSDDLIWQTSGDMPIMLVQTICRLDRVHEQWGGSWPKNNVWQFDIGEFRCWLSAVVGYVDASGARRHTGNLRSPVVLDLNSRFFNEAGDRITR